MIDKLAEKFRRWREVRYYGKVEGVLKAKGLYLPVLELQGADQEFCTLSLKLYRAGYVADLSPSKIAMAVVQAASICRLDRQRGLEGMERLLAGERQFPVQPRPHPGPSVDPALAAIRQERVDENLRIIFTVTNQVIDEISQEVDSGGRDRLYGPLGSFGQGLAQMGRTDVALLVFGIHAICKIRHNPAYFDSEDHKDTKNAFLKELAEQNLAITDRLGVKGVDERILREKLRAEILECEGNVREFCLQLRAGNTTSPDAGLIATFVKRTTIRKISGRPIEELVHDYLRVIYELTYAAPGTRSS